MLLDLLCLYSYENTAYTLIVGTGLEILGGVLVRTYLTSFSASSPVVLKRGHLAH